MNKKFYLILITLLVLSTYSLFSDDMKVQNDLNLEDLTDTVTEVIEETPQINFEKPVQIFDLANWVDKTPLVDSINDYQFIYDYYKTIESSLNRNRKTGKLGKRTIEGLKSGFFHYRCRLTGWNKVTVTMIYENYCDFDYIINGTTIVQTNWFADGVMTGTIYATGPTDAEVVYNLVITDGVESSGVYVVDRPKNNYKFMIPSDIVLSFANRDIELDDRCKSKN